MSTSTAEQTRCAAELRAGDLLDLRGDRYADPNRTAPDATQVAWVLARPDGTLVSLLGLGPVTFPPSHQLHRVGAAPAAPVDHTAVMLAALRAA